MSWKNAPEYDKAPKERAEHLIQKYLSISLAYRVQSEIIKKLKNHGIHSEYENQVLIELKN